MGLHLEQHAALIIRVQLRGSDGSDHAGQELTADPLIMGQITELLTVLRMVLQQKPSSSPIGSSSMGHGSHQGIGVVGVTTENRHQRQEGAP